MTARETAEKAAAWAESVAADDSHGYDQGNRWGPDYDCSSLVISAYKAAGVALTSTYTGNMWQDFLAHGFAVARDADLTTGAGLRRGDVLLNVQRHAAMYIGDGRIVQARSNENGGVTGGQTGDQTGREICTTPYFNFPWDCVLRYEEETGEDPSTPPDGSARDDKRGGAADGSARDDNAQEGVYVVRTGDTLWGIAETVYGDPWKYHEIEVANHIKNAVIYPGQVLIIPGAAGGKKVSLTVEVEAETAQLLRIMSEGSGMSIGEVIDMLLEDAR